MIRRLALVALLSLPAAPLWAAECSVDIDSTDQMTYSTNAIEIAKSCQQFTVNLKHVASCRRTSWAQLGAHPAGGHDAGGQRGRRGRPG